MTMNLLVFLTNFPSRVLLLALTLTVMLLVMELV